MEVETDWSIMAKVALLMFFFSYLWNSLLYQLFCIDDLALHFLAGINKVHFVLFLKYRKAEYPLYKCPVMLSAYLF